MRALFDVATELEKIALNDEYFVSRHLYPNVDFYTGLIYRAIGFDPSMFTTLFALGRIPGWIAQYREMLADPNTKIWSPPSGVHRLHRTRLCSDRPSIVAFSLFHGIVTPFAKPGCSIARKRASNAITIVKERRMTDQAHCVGLGSGQRGRGRQYSGCLVSGIEAW